MLQISFFDVKVALDVILIMAWLQRRKTGQQVWISHWNIPRWKCIILYVLTNLTFQCNKFYGSIWYHLTSVFLTKYDDNTYPNHKDPTLCLQFPTLWINSFCKYKNMLHTDWSWPFFISGARKLTLNIPWHIAIIVYFVNQPTWVDHAVDIWLFYRWTKTD